MKKLIFAAAGLVACTAFAKVDSTGGSETLPIDPGVYNITLTHKGLEYATKTYSAAQVTTGLNKEDPYETEEEALFNGQQAFDNIVAENFQGFEDYCSLTKCAAKKSSKGYTWSISYIAPTLTKGKPATKVVSTTINGLYFVDVDKTARTYLWNNAVKDTFINTYAKADTTKSYNYTDEDKDKVLDKKNELENNVGENVGDVVEGSVSEVTASGKKWRVTWKEITKKNPISLACGYDESDWFSVDSQTVVTADGKAASGFAWDNMQGWGTGTAKKDNVKESQTYNEYTSVSSVSGNTVDRAVGVYGTWKFSLDTAATKKYDGANIEEVLASKKVELCQ